jgi:glycosyltransferase involved in cell wall biosynthesis
MYHQPLAALLQTRLDAYPVVVTPHYHGEGKNSLTNLLHYPWGASLGKFFFKKADSIIAVSDSEKNKIMSKFKGLEHKITVIPNGVIQGSEIYLNTNKEIPEMLKNQVSKNDLIVTYVGRIEEYKNIHKLLTYAQGTNWKVVVVGKGSYLPSLTKLNNSFENKAVLLGELNEKDTEKIFAVTNCYASLSNQEAFGLNVAQLASQGVPVVCSDIPAHRYVQNLDPTSNVFLVNPESFHDVVTKINSCYAMQRKKAEFPTWEDVGIATKELYEKTIEKHKSKNANTELYTRRGNNAHNALS